MLIAVQIFFKNGLALSVTALPCHLSQRERLGGVYSNSFNAATTRCYSFSTGGKRVSAPSSVPPRSASVRALAGA